MPTEGFRKSQQFSPLASATELGSPDAYSTVDDPAGVVTRIGWPALLYARDTELPSGSRAVVNLPVVSYSSVAVLSSAFFTVNG